MKHAILLMARELHQGGSERQLTEIALGLDAARFEPHVATFRPEGLRGDQLRAAGVPVVQFPVLSFRSSGALAGIWRMARYIRHHNIRLVHSFDPPLTVYGMPTARYFTSARLLSSQRGHRALAPKFRKLVRWTDGFVDGIVVNCKYLQEHLMNEEGVPERLIHVCYNGIDLKQFCRIPSPRPPSLPLDAFVIGAVCELRPEKGLTTLIEAFARVRPFGREMKLAIVGSGPALSQLQECANQVGVSRDCVWEPATAAVPVWLRSIDIFVLPSLNEALSNSLMEAMACRCPVIASNVGGNLELVKHGERGLLFEQQDVDSLTNAMRRLIEDAGLRQRLAIAGEQFVRDGFSREASALRMAQIYETILASGPRQIW